MSFSKKPSSRAHLLVLSLCVFGCLATALWPRPENRATSHIPVVPGPELEQPNPVLTGKADRPPAR